MFRFLTRYKYFLFYDRVLFLSSLYIGLRRVLNKIFIDLEITSQKAVY